MEQKKLLTRQWQLYNLIKHNSLVENRKTTQKEICDNLLDYEWKDEKNSHDHCTMVWSDIAAINDSEQIDKLIISKNFEYWIGTEEETREHLERLWNALRPRLSRFWRFKKKMALNGQGKLLDNNGNPISEESMARAFHEMFKSEESKTTKTESFFAGDDNLW